ncbi:MAG: triacylglycerol lipase [Spirochaetales bacterium]|nr:triacylglycerol lipase [Spirochaetales bacterium]
MRESSRVPGICALEVFFNIIRGMIVCLSAVFLVSSSTADHAPQWITPDFPQRNQTPIVLLHGFGGFGRDEALGVRYWGIFTDLQEQLSKDGFSVFTPAVGPISSNWDRACELYAVLKGGTVDYGTVHSARFGHSRYGRTYPGLFPLWGETDSSTGLVRKIHIIGHSMGGQTARLLAALLERGSEEERAAAGESLSPLFAGGRHWIFSILTLNSPHDGISQVENIDYDSPWFRRLWTYTIALSENGLKDFYDFKLDQWEIRPHPGESFFDFSTRISSDRRWQETEDGCFFDVSPEGAALLNRAAPALSDVYYFSWAADTSETGPEGTRIPGFWTNPFIRDGTQFMGRYIRNVPGKVLLDESWWPSDGVVNTCSMDGPTLDSDDRIVVWNNSGEHPEPGVWNFLGTLPDTDHIDIIGICFPVNYAPSGFHSLVDFYIWNARLLASLPPTE